MFIKLKGVYTRCSMYNLLQWDDCNANSNYKNVHIFKDQVKLKNNIHYNKIIIIINK